MNYKDSIRYKAGDIIVKNIFTCFNDISSKEHIANRIIILDELFSTNIRRFSGDAGLKHICNTLLNNEAHLGLDILKDISVDEISEIIDKIIIEYHAKGYPRCMSFVTKYLFWSVYAFADNHDDYKNFFIYDRLVARKIKLSTPTSNVGFYKKWHGKMQKIKEKNGFKDNREMDLELWSNQKATETEQRKKTKLTHVPNK